ncbi:MAG TPA: hypothetical protein VF482_22685, partial [Trebonia sp.]
MKKPAFRPIRTTRAFRKASWRVPARKVLVGPVALLLVTGVVLAALAAPAPAATRTAAGTVARLTGSTQVVVTTEQTAFGEVLATGSGLPLYGFSGQDLPALFGSTAVGCTAQDGCQAFWPPLLVPAGTPAVAMGGARPGKLGTAPFSATQAQVTYAGHRLYTFVRDTPGISNGENATVFNGVFWLLSPSGAIDGGQGTAALEVSANGVVLASAHGTAQRTLYQLTNDPPEQATCTGLCAEVWPPLISSTPAVAGTGVS